MNDLKIVKNVKTMLSSIITEMIYEINLAYFFIKV